MKEKIRILCDFLRVVGDKRENYRYIAVLTPKESEADNWEGALTAIKNNIEKILSKMQGALNKRFQNMHTDLSGLKSQNTNLDFKLGDLQANAQTNSVKVEKEFVEIRKSVKKGNEARKRALEEVKTEVTAMKKDMADIKESLKEIHTSVVKK